MQNSQKLLVQIPGETLLTLAERARQQTIERGLPGMMFSHAEGLVQRGHVALTGRNAGQVFDLGRWAPVSLKYCQHCGVDGVCAHQLAVAYADLLARHAPIPRDAKPMAEARGGGAAGGFGGSGSVAGLMPGRRLRAGRSHAKGKRSGGGARRCPRCGAFTKAGNCRNPKCKSKR